MHMEDSIYNIGTYMHIPIHTYVNAICEHISVYKLFVVTTIQTREYPFFNVKTFSIS